MSGYPEEVCFFRRAKLLFLPCNRSTNRLKIRDSDEQSNAYSQLGLASRRLPSPNQSFPSSGGRFSTNYACRRVAVWQHAPPEIMRREARGEPSEKLALLRGLGRFEQVLGGYGRYQDALRLPARIKNQESRTVCGTLWQDQPGQKGLCGPSSKLLSIFQFEAG
jgi:hypothetical protein